MGKSLHSIVVPPNHGVVSVDESMNGQFVYTPDDNYFGDDSSHTASLMIPAFSDIDGVVSIIIADAMTCRWQPATPSRMNTPLIPLTRQ